MKYKCPCCGYYTLPEEPPGTDHICKVCFWQDDYVQYQQPDYSDGANEASLNQARTNYKKFKASESKFIAYVRAPLGEELPENNK
jgi:hypothetical protein